MSHAGPRYNYTDMVLVKALLWILFREQYDMNRPVRRALRANSFTELFPCAAQHCTVICECIEHALVLFLQIDIDVRYTNCFKHVSVSGL